MFPVIRVFFTNMALYTFRDNTILFIQVRNRIINLLIIPHGMVDNNLGPDRLSGPKAVDPNYFRQLTL